MDKTKYYAYGIIETSQPKTFGYGGDGTTGGKLYTINYKNIALVVSNTSELSCLPTSEKARSHHQIIARIMQEHTIIPIRFGTLFSEEKEAVELLASAYEDIKKTLAFLRNKIELGLKVIWKKDVLVTELEREYEDLRKYKEEIMTMPDKYTYQAAIRLGQMVEVALSELRDIYIREICEPLQHLAVDARFNKLLNERMVLNAAFLVEKDREAEFDAKVNEIYEQYQHKFDFKYSGPWPPYNFVNLHLD